MIRRFDRFEVSAPSFPVFRMYQQFDHHTVRMIAPPGHRGHDAYWFNLTQMPGDETPNPTTDLNFGGRTDPAGQIQPVNAGSARFRWSWIRTLA